MSPDTFWGLTYAELCLALDGYKLRIEQGMSESWWAAHLTTVGYHQPKKFPKLTSIVRPANSMSNEKREDIKSFLNSVPKTKKPRNKS